MSPYYIVPILDVDEMMLLSRQEVLSGSCFPTLRTDALGRSSRKFLFMKLLYQTIFSADLKVQVDGMFVEGHDLSLRPIVDLTTKSEDNNSNSISNSNSNDNNNNISVTGNGYDDDDAIAPPASGKTLPSSLCCMYYYQSITFR
jgi:hypothetical protein